MLNKLFCLFALTSLVSFGVYADEPNDDQPKNEQIVVTIEEDQDISDESNEALVDADCGCKKKKQEPALSCKKKKKKHLLSHHDGEHDDDEEENDQLAANDEDPNEEEKEIFANCNCGKSGCDIDSDDQQKELA